MDDTVIRMGTAFATRGPMMPVTPTSASSPLRQVRGYWEGLRQSGSIPARDALDPRGMVGALEQVFVIERIAPGLARFKLVGSHVTEVFGCEVRGMPFTTLFDPPGRGAVGPVLECVFAIPAILHMDLEAERALGRPALRAQLLILPLSSHGGRIDMALGCLTLDGVTGRAPRRFAIARSMTEKLATSRGGVDPAIAERTEPQAAAPLPQPPRGQGPHLRLVHSAD
jgi:hypothetical protein